MLSIGGDALSWSPHTLEEIFCQFVTYYKTSVVVAWCDILFCQVLTKPSLGHVLEHKVSSSPNDFISFIKFCTKRLHIVIMFPPPTICIIVSVHHPLLHIRKLNRQNQKWNRGITICHKIMLHLIRCYYSLVVGSDSKP